MLNSLRVAVWTAQVGLYLIEFSTAAKPTKVPETSLLYSALGTRTRFHLSNLKLHGSRLCLKSNRFRLQF